MLFLLYIQYMLYVLFMLYILNNSLYIEVLNSYSAQRKFHSTCDERSLLMTPATDCGAHGSQNTKFLCADCTCVIPGWLMCVSFPCERFHIYSVVKRQLNHVLKASCEGKLWFNSWDVWTTALFRGHLLPGCSNYRYLYRGTLRNERVPYH